VKHTLRIGITLAFTVLAASCVTTPKEPVSFAGAPCTRPPPMHCPDAGCPSEISTNQGAVVEPKTSRTYFLDYPCDLKPDEDVTVILALHGGGSYGNWQRNYAPFMDYVDKYRLVVATPSTRGWSDADDAYLQNIVTGVFEALGKDNVKSFWLAGHSMGGYYSRRIVCSSFFRDKTDGLLSLSGGRMGNPPGTPPSALVIPPINGSSPRPAGPPRAGAGGPPSGANGPLAAIAAAESALNDCDFSYIFANGEHEPSSQTRAVTSSWAEKYGCRPREQTDEIVDAKAGYVYDASRQEFGSDMWGRLPRGGSAVVMEYRGCHDNRLVADVMRKGKGHTEGLEPHVTEKLVQMMVKAPGGKLRAS
jgi:pimeloyl-ACP methyl ester carboxylesterase